MGNCQAAEAATVVIQHPINNKIERIYWSVSANHVMASNPGHYVALVITSPALKPENGTPAPAKATVKQLKLLRPDDTLLIGHVYRLISFEDVLKEFAAKKCVKLGRLLKERGALPVPAAAASMEKPRLVKMMKKKDPVSGNGALFLRTETQTCSDSNKEDCRIGSNGGSSSRGVARHYGGQWKPALESIEELGSSKAPTTLSS